MWEGGREGEWEGGRERGREEGGEGCQVWQEQGGVHDEGMDGRGAGGRGPLAVS